MVFPLIAVSRSSKILRFRPPLPCLRWLRFLCTLAGLGVPQTGFCAKQIVELPPYTVTDSPIPPWRYASLPGVEVISRCPDNITRQLIDRQHRLHELLGLILPKQFQPRREVPLIYVLYGDTTQSVETRHIVERMTQLQNSAEAGKATAQAEREVNVQFMPNYRFWDQDSLAIFLVLDQISSDHANITLSPGYLRYLLETRTPVLPLWFIAGLQELYPNISMPVPPVVPPLAGMSGSMETWRQPTAEADVATFRQFIWISEARTKALLKHRELEPDILPLATLFTELRPANHDETFQSLWRAGAALFIRWALDPEKGSVKQPQPPDLPVLEPKYLAAEALWKFLARACAEPVTEEIFRECFGQDFTDAERRLRHYRLQAPGNIFQLRPVQPIQSPQFDLTNAGTEEISRLKGSLARLEIDYIKERYPQLADLYLEQARRTLRKSFDEGNRDPRVLAELGLTECAAGDDKTALPLLEAAVSGKVLRPRPYYELARIYLRELKTKSPDRKLSTAEAGKILAPLEIALRLNPPLAEIYELIAEVWLLTDARLSQAQFAVLDEGIRNFRRRSQLIFYAALLHSSQGQVFEARALIQKGLGVVESAQAEAPFLKLQAALDANADVSAK